MYIYWNVNHAEAESLFKARPVQQSHDTTTMTSSWAVRRRSVSSVIISRQIADDSCHWLLMTFIIKIPYRGGTQRTKGKITQVMNGPFIFESDIRLTRLVCMNIGFRGKSLNMVSKKSPVFLIVPEPVCMCVWECKCVCAEKYGNQGHTDRAEVRYKSDCVNKKGSKLQHTLF